MCARNDAKHQGLCVQALDLAEICNSLVDGIASDEDYLRATLKGERRADYLQRGFYLFFVLGGLNPCKALGRRDLRQTHLIMNGLEHQVKNEVILAVVSTLGLANANQRRPSRQHDQRVLTGRGGCLPHQVSNPQPKYLTPLQPKQSANIALNIRRFPILQERHVYLPTHHENAETGGLLETGALLN